MDGRWSVPIARDSTVTPASACRLRLLGPAFASGGRTSPVEPAPPVHVVGHVGERDGRTRPREADGADHQPHDPFLMREGMLDMGAHRGFGRVRPRMVPRLRPASRLASMDAADTAEAGQIPLVLRRPICGVGPDIGGGVVRIDQSLAQLRPVMAAASVVLPRRITPCRRSIEICDL